MVAFCESVAVVHRAVEDGGAWHTAATGRPLPKNASIKAFDFSLSTR